MNRRVSWMNRLRQSWINVDIYEAAQTFGHEPVKITDIFIYIYVTAYVYIYIFIDVDIRTLEDIPQRTGLLQIHRRFFSQGNSGLFLTRDANPAGLDQPSRSSEWIFNRNVWMCLPSFIWVKLDLAVQFA